MRIKFLDLSQNNDDLVSLSVAELTELSGGGVNDNLYYQESLSAYAKGNAAISNEGDVITFDSTSGYNSRGNNVTNPLFETSFSRFGTAKPTNASFQVKGNEITYLGSDFSR